MIAGFIVTLIMSSQTLSGSNPNPQQQWDSALYDSKHAFVSKLGTSLVELLMPQAGEQILDLGCGTGHLADEIHRYGAEIIGIDSSIAMIEQAQKNYPNLRFELGDATQLQFSTCFDAVFSNAVLHWVTEPQKAIARIWHVLKPGGRFVAEFGGKGNVGAIVTALADTLKAANYPALSPWYFPSISEYSTLLEQQGFEVTFAHLFDRPTPLADGNQGLQNWIRMFASSFLESVPPEVLSEILAQVESRLRSQLYQNGTWYADYRRIRIVARKPALGQD
jgi:trans-aconitate methyltransferase